MIPEKFLLRCCSANSVQEWLLCIVLEEPNISMSTALYVVPRLKRFFLKLSNRRNWPDYLDEKLEFVNRKNCRSSAKFLCCTIVADLLLQ